MADAIPVSVKFVMSMSPEVVRYGFETPESTALKMMTSLMRLSLAAVAVAWPP
jgi:hypothetical protein